MDNFFAKKGIGLSRGGGSSVQIKHDHLIKSPETDFKSNIPQMYMTKPQQESTWTPGPSHPHVNFNHPPFHSYNNESSYRSTAYLQHESTMNVQPVKHEIGFTHMKTASEIPLGKSNYLQSEFRELQAQFPSVST